MQHQVVHNLLTSTLAQPAFNVVNIIGPAFEWSVPRGRFVPQQDQATNQLQMLSNIPPMPFRMNITM